MAASYLIFYRMYVSAIAFYDGALPRMGYCYAATSDHPCIGTASWSTCGRQY